MRRCPITYEQIKGKGLYSPNGLRLLSPTLKNLKKLPYSAQEQRREAEARSSKLSIQGVQPKISATLNIKNQTFDLADKGGRYILKPQVERFKCLPENEDLTMKLARIVGVEVPPHGLIYSKDGTLTYFIKRFDRAGQKSKLHVEDFAQLSGESRDTKYDSSMEQVAEVIAKFCTFPALENVKLFRLTMFSFLVGNEDMHLKNFSLIVRKEKVELSPAYDLVNSTLVIASPKEQLALPIRGKRNKLTREDLIEYFAIERLKISKPVVAGVVRAFTAGFSEWRNLIQKSFLPPHLRKQFVEIVRARANSIKLEGFG